MITFKMCLNLLHCVRCKILLRSRSITKYKTSEVRFLRCLKETQKPKLDEHIPGGFGGLKQ